MRTAKMSAMASPFRIPEFHQASADVVQDGSKSADPPGCDYSILHAYDVTEAH